MNLADKGILVRLKISCWNGVIHDKRASNQIADTFNSDPEAGKLNKQLVPKKLLKKVQKAANHTRARFNTLTLPWLDDGERIISINHYGHLKQEISQMRQEFRVEVDEFVEQYADFVGSNAEERMGDLFNSEDYPSTDRIKDRFSMALVPLPLPSTGDWRIDDQQLRSALQESLEGSLEEAKGLITKDLGFRIGERLHALITRLRKTDTRFRKTTITALKSTIDLVDSQLNLVEDESITNICQGISQKIGLVNEDWQIDELRKDPASRNQLADSLDESYALLTGEFVDAELAPTVGTESVLPQETPEPPVQPEELPAQPEELPVQLAKPPNNDGIGVGLSGFQLPEGDI